jgi:2',3'-cyclic-nucleotide 2'-phosphodiesterase (5'-nucleotidase family)
MDSAMNEQVAFSNQEYFKQKPNGLLNNLIADMLLNEVAKTSNIEIDFCMLNYGGLRRPLPEGKIIKSDIFQLMPFENEAVLVKLKPQAMSHLFKYIYFSGGQPVSSIEMHYNDSVLNYALINGEQWDSLKSYWVLTSDYTANGGDRMTFFLERDSMILTSVLLRSAIFSYLDSLQDNNITLIADTTNRIYFNN